MIHVQIVLRIKNCEIWKFEVCSRGPENLSFFEVSLLSRAGFSIFSKSRHPKSNKNVDWKNGREKLLCPRPEVYDQMRVREKIPMSQIFWATKLFFSILQLPLNPKRTFDVGGDCFWSKKTFHARIVVDFNNFPWTIVKSGSLYGHVFFQDLKSRG